MANQFSSGKHSIAICDRCGFQFKLSTLRSEVIKSRLYDIRVCNQCFDPDHPQLHLGEVPISDPQAVRNPRVDTSYKQAGLDTLGFPSGGSRNIQWGWGPVGFHNDFYETPNDLLIKVTIGTVSVVTT